MAPKRKRATSTASKNPPTKNTSTHSSRPASRDVPQNENVEQIDAGAQNPTDPPAKRTRASSSAAHSKKSGKSAINCGVVNDKESEEMEIETGGRVEMPVDGAAVGGGQHGEAGKMRMEAPPKAGIVDPAGGYRTNRPPRGRSVRVYADGVFDLFHLGHMRVLQQAKTAFPDTYLIVGVTGDQETHDRKGLTVMSAKERADSVRHCRWVDEVIEDCPWIIDVEFLEKHDIDYVAHDDLPYGASEGDDIYKPIKEKGMFLVTQRTEGVSTTGIITKIVRDYEHYVGRQLKRGTSRQELNISWLKKNELDMRRQVAELRDTIRNNWTTTGQELGREFRQFWQPSRSSSPAPSIATSARSPRAARRVQHGDGENRASTPQKGLDFATGYAMGLIGGVKGWMEGSRRRTLGDTGAASPGADSDAERSPADSWADGMNRAQARKSANEQLVEQMRS